MELFCTRPRQAHCRSYLCDGDFSGCGVASGLWPRSVRTEWPGNDRTLSVEGRVGKLGTGVVFLVEQIVNLDGQLEASAQIVMRSEIGHGIAWRYAGAEVVYSVRLVRVVFIAARVGARHDNFNQFECQPLRGLIFQVGLPRLFRYHLDPA